MKKDSFIKGAVVATACIVFSKILGILYVIPFHAIIGENGRALYGYAYNIYMLFLNFSTMGIPLAISKMVSEYHSLGYEDAKKRTYKLALKIVSAIAIVSTIILFVFAPNIAKMIIGDLKGGNTIKDIVFVVRISSSAIFFVTVLSAVRGYLQGHKYISVSSISQVLEQLVRVIIIIIGSYVAMKLWGTKEAIGIAVFGATAGAIVALLFLEKKMFTIRKEDKNIKIKNQEKEITNKIIFKKLLKYTVPFIIVSIAISLYNTIDMFTVIKPLVKYGNFKVKDAEAILSVVTTWGAKLNVIVTSIAAGVVTAMLPNVTSDFVKKDLKAVENKANKTLQIVLFFALPMVIGLSFLAPAVWNIFYGTNALKINVFRFSIFTAVFYSLFLNLHTMLQSVNHNKVANISIISGLCIKILFNIPMIILFSRIPFIPTYYASVFVTILAYIIPIIISLYDLNKNLKISFKSTIKNVGWILLAIFAMLIVLLSLKLFIPTTGSRIYSLVVIALYGGIGMIIYFGITTKAKVFENIFGSDLKTFIRKRLKKQ